MSRTHYRNGDEIGLESNGCDGCQPSVIQGFLCHELGCPDAWRDRESKCIECGSTFKMDRRNQQVCQGCIDDIEEDEADEEFDDLCHDDDDDDDTDE